MVSILQSLSKTIHLSIAIAVLLFIYLFFAGDLAIDQLFWSWLFRYLHVVSGVMWIGLLWYFNFVQIPNMANIPDEQKPAIGKVIAPAALFWFRWAAFFTIITGLIVAYLNGYIHEALVLGVGSGGGKSTAIGIGSKTAIIDPTTGIKFSKNVSEPKINASSKPKNQYINPAATAVIEEVINLVKIYFFT